MRVRHENGCTIISDVYEPRPLPRRANRALHIFLTLAAIAIATGILLGLAHAMS